MDIILPLITIGIPGAVVLFALSRRLPRDEANFLGRLLLIAFALRILSATMFGALPETRMFHEDADGYERIGVTIARSWHGHGPSIEAMLPVQNYGYHYFTAASYYVFGDYRVVPSYINSFLGTLTVLLVYLLARRFFHPVVARRSALLTAIMPSMVLWSSLAIKDTLVTFLIVMALLSCVRLKRQISVAALLGTLLPIAAIQPVRFYIVYFIGLAVIGSLLLERSMRVITGVPKLLLLGAAGALLLTVVGLSSGAQEGMEVFDLARVSSFRNGMAITANSGFAADVDISTPIGALTFLPVGLVTLLFSPFPWQFTSVRALFAAPETIFWWTLFPSLVRGVRYVFRERFTEASPIILFTVALLPAYSLVHGNVGSGFRQRAQIFVFLFIFTSLGQYVKRARSRGIDEKMLLSDGPAAAAEAAS